MNYNNLKFDQTHNNRLFEFNMNIGNVSIVSVQGIVFILDKHKKQLLKTTDRYITTYIILLFICYSYCLEFEIFTTRQKNRFYIQNSRKKNIYLQLLSSCGSDMLFLSHPLSFYFFIYNTNV